MPAWAWAGARLAFSLALIAAASEVVQLQAPASSMPSAPRVPQSAVQPQQAVEVAAEPASLIPFPVRHMLRVERPLRHGDYVWDEAGVPPGRVRIFVDLGTETMHVFRNGFEIGRAIVLYGIDEQPTPLGTFPISEKDIDHISNLYEAAMPYMLRLTNDGVAIHGSNVRLGSASRGCIGVPDEFAALLFEQARLGDAVTIVDSSKAALPVA